MTDGVPAGHVVAVRPVREVEGEPLALDAGDLDATLAVAGLPLTELPAGTRLRIGAQAVLELGGGPAPARGLVDLDGGPDAAPLPARVRAAGVVRAGDPVTIEAVPVPLEDALDLHPFRPEEIPDVVAEYLGRAHAAGLVSVRLVHGRGRGVQRAAVRRVLGGSPLVAGFADAPADRGGWGATVVTLRREAAGGTGGRP